jgi:hypothetical protein
LDVGDVVDRDEAEPVDVRKIITDASIDATQFADGYFRTGAPLVAEVSSVHKS